MRIAHIITRMIIGGAQENTWLTCRGLQEQFGDHVLLITGPTTGPEGRLLEQGGSFDIEVQEIHSLRRNISPARDFVAYQAMQRALSDFQPDVVHTHSAKGGILGRAAAWRLHIPAVVHTVHGAPFHSYQSRIARATFRTCETWAAKRCHAMIGVADAMRDQLVEAGVAPTEKFTTIYSGMELEPYLTANQWRRDTRRQLGYDDHHIVVGKIARLCRLKGHQFVIDAAADAIRRVPNLRFLFIGDGALGQVLKQRIQRARLQSHFQFTGLVHPDDIPRMLGAIDLLVHTSLREGLPRTLPQALLAGKPVVSFNIDGAREVCIPEKTGYLVPPEDSAGLTHAIIRLAESPETRSEMGEHGRRLCRSRFDHQAMVVQIREVYQRVLQQPC